MARLGSKLMKRPGYQLKIRVGKAYPYYNPIAKPSNIIPLRFSTISHKNYLHSPTLSLIGLEKLHTGTQTLSVDRRDFFESDSSIKTLKSVLEPLKVKEDIVNKIIRQVMGCGKRLNKKEDFPGLDVCMTVSKTFVGDRASVHKALRKLNRERNEYLRQQGGFNVVHLC